MSFSNRGWFYAHYFSMRKTLFQPSIRIKADRNIHIRWHEFLDKCGDIWQSFA